MFNYVMLLYTCQKRAQEECECDGVKHYDRMRKYWRIFSKSQVPGSEEIGTIQNGMAHSLNAKIRCDSFENV